MPKQVKRRAKDDRKPAPLDPERRPWPLFAALLADPVARARIDAAHEAATPGAEDARALQRRIRALLAQVSR